MHSVLKSLPGISGERKHALFRHFKQTHQIQTGRLHQTGGSPVLHLCHPHGKRMR